MVGMTGFEPVLPCSQNKCFAKLSYIPKYWLGYLDSNQGNARFRVWCLTTWLHPNDGGLRRARTFDLTVNSRLLSPLSYESVNAQHLQIRWKAGYSPRFILCKCCVVNLLKKIVKKKNNDINAITKREVVGSCFLPRAFSPQRVQARLQIRIKYAKPDACL